MNQLLFKSLLENGIEKHIEMLIVHSRIFVFDPQVFSPHLANLTMGESVEEGLVIVENELQQNQIVH